MHASPSFPPAFPSFSVKLYLTKWYYWYKIEILESISIINLFGNFSFRTGYTRMRCLKSRYLSDFKLAGLSGNLVSEQV